jgi:hypothetical protein
MPAVSALLPVVPQADVRRLMNGFETGVGIDVSDVPLNDTWSSVRFRVLAMLHCPSREVHGC